MMSKESLLREARRHNYKPEILEKVYQLIATLEKISQVPFLKDKIVLKGGTALNLFHFEDIPRLSVDIDLNYIGKLSRSEMLEERPLINEAIEQILLQSEFERYRAPYHHAGGKMVWRYQSVLGQKGNLEIDLNYMYRQPLWPTELKIQNLTNDNGFKFPVLNIHELAAGKLSALMTRGASRDIFDTHYLLKNCALEDKKLRFSFVVYLAMTNMDLSSMLLPVVKYDVLDIRNRLVPVLRQKSIPRARPAMLTWAEKLVRELNEELSRILPLHENEIEFISMLRSSGIIDASIITNDQSLQAVVEHHPALQWAVKRFSRIKE